MSGLKLKWKRCSQEQIEEYMDTSYHELFDLCPYPALGSISEGTNVSKKQFDIDVSFMNRMHSISLSIENFPYTSDLKEQSIEIDKDVLIDVLKKIPDDNIILTIKDDCPLVISLLNDPISIFIAPNKEDDE